MVCMFEFSTNAVSKDALYADILAAIDGVTGSEPDAIANMANVAAILWEMLPDLNWSGFYRNIGGELVLGPFQGRAACIRIAFGKGVCGAAAQSLQTQLVDDVHAFPGHIACDAASRSEPCLIWIAQYRRGSTGMMHWGVRPSQNCSLCASDQKRDRFNHLLAFQHGIETVNPSAEATVNRRLGGLVLKEC
jgi:L-methionine (R)-S-oxide reductase